MDNNCDSTTHNHDGPYIIPPRMPDPPFVSTEPPARLPGEPRVTIVSGAATIEQQRQRILILEAETLQLARAKEESDRALKALDALCTDLLAQLNAEESAHIYANSTGLYVVDVANNKRYTLQLFDAPHCDPPTHYYPADGPTCFCGNTGMAAEPPKVY